MISNRFVYPRRGIFGAFSNWIANARTLAAIRRATLSKLPFMKLESDVSNIVYLNWVIPASLCMSRVPAGVTVIEKQGLTILTALTYAHGHFGPACFGALRQALPSPLQSNWRLYASSLPAEPSASHTVLFIKNIFNSRLYALGSRILSDALPSHVADIFVHEQRDLTYVTRITSGTGSAPELSCTCRVSEKTALPSEFQPFFASWAEAIEYLCCQDAAVCAVEGTAHIAHAGISLPIDLSRVTPLEADECQHGELLIALGAAGKPFCFAVPGVRFQALSEKLI